MSCLAPFAAAAGTGASAESTIVALWRALSNEPGKSADVATLAQIFHADAVVFGSRYRDGKPLLTVAPAAKFIESQSAASSDGFYECEIHREIRQYDRFATVYSVVESRSVRTAQKADFTGVNSIQLHHGADGWRIVSLYFQVELPTLAVPHGGGTPGKCLDG